MAVARLALAILGVTKFTKGTLRHAIRKLQEIGRVTARASISLTKTRFALWKTALACVAVVIKTVSTIRHAPCGQIGTRAFNPGVFAVMAVVREESTCEQRTQFWQLIYYNSPYTQWQWYFEKKVTYKKLKWVWILARTFNV